MNISTVPSVKTCGHGPPVLKNNALWCDTQCIRQHSAAVVSTSSCEIKMEYTI
jgi:hypothetical protein